VQRILQKHVGRSEFVDNTELAGLTLEVGEPAANDGLVIFLFGHPDIPSLWCCKSLTSATCPMGNPSERLTNSAFCRDIETSTASAARALFD
jgi:hypothetical protein